MQKCLIKLFFAVLALHNIFKLWLSYKYLEFVMSQNTENFFNLLEKMQVRNTLSLFFNRVARVASLKK